MTTKVLRRQQATSLKLILQTKLIQVPTGRLPKTNKVINVIKFGFHQNNFYLLFQ